MLETVNGKADGCNVVAAASAQFSGHTQLSDPMFQIQRPSLLYHIISCFALDETLLKPMRFTSSVYVRRSSVLGSKQNTDDGRSLD